MTIKLIVGLANPGSKYIETRHNAGAWYIDCLLNKYNQSLHEEKKFYGLIGNCTICDQNIRLLIPMTFINLSGKSVKAVSEFYNYFPEEVLIIHDEINLSPGEINIKKGGSHRGHNGLKNVILMFGKKSQFYRISIGIGCPENKNDIVNFVLNKPLKEEKKLIDYAITESVNNIETLIFYKLEDI